MSALPPVPAIVLGCSVLVAASAACLGLAARPAASSAGRASRLRTDRSSGRSIAAATIGFVVLLATRWVLLAAAAAVLVLVWDALVRDPAAEDERRRIEGIAKWLEDLRDTLRASSIGAEEALEQTAARPPAAIADALAIFLLRRRQGLRIDDALTDLADALAHPTSDAAVAAMKLVTNGSAGAGRLHPTVDALAAAARDEVRARERVDRTRAVYQGSMRRLIAIGALLVAYLRFGAGDLLDPYSTATGQLVLGLPIALWCGCILWLRRLCRYEPPAREVARTEVRGELTAAGAARS